MFPSLFSDQQRLKQPVPCSLILFLAVLAVLLLAFQGSAQTVAEYPYVRTTPAHPTVEDQAAMQLVMGLAGSSCGLATYTDLSYSVTLVSGGQSPVYQIEVLYTEVPPPPDLICPFIYDPTEYGPSYELGLLPKGLYIVRDGNSVVDSFEVTLEPVVTRAVISGSVLEDAGARDVIIMVANATVYLQVPEIFYPAPYEPQPLQPLQQDEYMPVRTVDTAVTDEFGRFALDAVEAGDYQLTVISDGHQSRSVWLSLTADTMVTITLLPVGATGTLMGTVTEACPDGQVCLWNPPVPACTVRVSILIPMYEMVQKSAAGEFEVITDTDGAYRIEGIPIYSYPVYYSVQARKQGFEQAVKAGEPVYDQAVRLDFELTRGVLAALPGTRTRVSTAEARLSPDGRTLTLMLPSAQNVRVDAFDLQGKRLEAFSLNRRLPSGATSLACDLKARGVSVLQVNGEDFNQVIRLTHAR